MYAFRQCASRLLTSRPSSLILPSRAYSSFVTSSTQRPTQRSSLFLSTRRWASSEGQGDAPISNLQSEVAEQSEATDAKVAPAIAESANLTEATEEALPAAETNEKIVAQEPASVTEAAERTFAIPRNYRENQDQGGVTRSTRNEPPQKKNTVYIGNLFFDITESELVKEFTQFGTVTRCKIIRDSRGLSKGFAYLEFAELDSAESAVRTMNMQLYEGRRMTVQYAARNVDEPPPGQVPKRPINPPSKTLFIGNMSFEMTDRDLGNLFRGIRNVIDVRVAIDRRTGQPRGFAHADFIDQKSAQEAMKVLQDKETYGRKLRIDFSYSSSQSPRNQAGAPRSHPTETTRAEPRGEDN